MSTTLRKLPLVLPLTLVFAGACWAQTSAISGDVKGEDGKPLQGAMIKIDRQDQKVKKPYEVKTDKKGHYYYGGLGAPGQYNVSVEVNGQVKESYEKVPTKLGATAEVNFDLQKVAAAAAAASGAGGAAAPPPEASRELSAAEKAAAEKK